MEKEADGLLDAGPAQFGSQGNQVIVVHPDHVVRLKQRNQLAGKQRVDAAVRLVLPSAVGEVAQEIVQQGPQTIVTETVVIALEIALVQINGREGDIVLLDQPGIPGFGGQRAAPAKPDTPPLGECRQHSHGQATRRAAGLAHAHPVGDGNQPAHSASSQERLKRMAPLMMPTML